MVKTLHSLIRCFQQLCGVGVGINQGEEVGGIAVLVLNVVVLAVGAEEVLVDREELEEDFNDVEV